MPFTNSQAADLGLLAMYAMDMYRESGRLIPDARPELAARGWSVLGFIVGKNALFRNLSVDLTEEDKYYGYVARHADGEVAAVFRGTAQFIEWIEDAEFVPLVYAPRIALEGPPSGMTVEQGFWSLYGSMRLFRDEITDLGPLVDAIETRPEVAGAAPITVVGHSLGAALATYLTLDLKRGPIGDRVSACLFASPHTGNKAFVDYFDTIVADSRLFNYILDVVPRVPLGPDSVPLPRRTILQPATAEARVRVDVACNHHVVCYCAMLDYEGTMRALRSPPEGESNSIPCILGPETGRPSIGKQIVAALAGLVPV